MKLSGKSVLIIDDDPKFIKIVSKILEAQGVKIFDSNDLKSAYKILEDNKPNIVLLDLELSEKENGSEFLIERKENSILKQIPVLICSANANKIIVRKVFELGATDFIVKPIRQDYLIRKLKKVLSQSNELVYKFTPEESSQSIEVGCWAELIQLGEVNCKLRSSTNIMKGKDFYVDFEGLREVFDIEIIKSNSQFENFKKPRLCRSNSRSVPSSLGLYSTLSTIVGVGEKEASVLREIKVKWRK